MNDKRTQYTKMVRPTKSHLAWQRARKEMSK